MSPNTELHRLFESWLRWFRFRRSLIWAGRGLAVGAGAAALFGVYALVGKNVLQSEYRVGLAILIAAGPVLGLVAGLAWPYSRQPAARFFDRRLDLKERVSTAFELEGASGTGNSRFAPIQAADALATARAVRIRNQMPLRWPGRELLAAALLLAVCIGIWFAAVDSFTRAAQRRQVQEAIASQAENLAELIEAIESSPELSEVQKDELTAPLEEALEALQQAATLEDAVNALEEAAQALNELADPEAQALAQSLQDAGSQLAQDGGPLEPFAENLAQGNFDQAAQDLREVDASAMEQAERERLAEQLESLAEALASSDPALAEQLQEAAQAARQGDPGEAQQALEQAAQAIQQAGEAGAQAQAAEGAAQSLEEGQQTLVDAGQQGEGQPGEVAGVPGQGEQPGAGDNGQSGESGGGAGTGEGGQNQPGGGQEAGEGPISQGNLPDGSGTAGFEPITPSSIAGGGSETVTLPPSGLEGENVVGLGPADLGSTSPSTVPYTEVLPFYQDAAFEAIDSGVIPPQFRDLIRDYFSSLEPD